MLLSDQASKEVIGLQDFSVLIKNVPTAFTWD